MRCVNLQGTYIGGLLMCLLIYLTICLISNVYISFIVGLLVGLVTYAIICRLFNCPELKHISKKL